MLRSRIGWVLFVTILVVALTADNEVTATPVACGIDEMFRPKHKRHPKEDADDDDKKKDDDDKDKDLKDKKKKFLKALEDILDDTSSPTTEKPRKPSKRKSKSKGLIEEFLSDYVKFVKFLMFAK